MRLWLDTLAVFACSLVFAALLAALVFLAEAASTPLGHPWSWGNGDGVKLRIVPCTVEKAKEYVEHVAALRSARRNAL